MEISELSFDFADRLHYIFLKAVLCSGDSHKSSQKVSKSKKRIKYVVLIVLQTMKKKSESSLKSLVM